MVDADCLVACVLTTRGAISRLLDKWLAGDFELVLCPRLTYEVRNALLSPPIADRYEISVADAKAFSRKLEEEGMLVDVPVDPPRAVPDDPNDDYLVALALTTDPGILVTRDRHFEKVDEERIGSSIQAKPSVFSRD